MIRIDLLEETEALLVHCCIYNCKKNIINKKKTNKTKKKYYKLSIPLMGQLLLNAAQSSHWVLVNPIHVSDLKYFFEY